MGLRFAGLHLTPTFRAPAAGSRGTPPRKPSAVVVVDTADECERVCMLLAAESRLAVDLEGIDLCRSGRVCVLQVGCADGCVYLFDICMLCAPDFPEPLRTHVLENDAVQKLMFDCRSDADALHHLHAVRIENVRGQPAGGFAHPKAISLTRCVCAQVVDLQVLCVKSFPRPSRFLPGMRKALSDVLSPVALDEAERLKSTGKKLFAPELGGSYDVWTQRPLAPALADYAAADVLHLFAMHERWGRLVAEPVMRRIVTARMRSTIDRVTPWPRGVKSKWSEVDFSF